MGRISSLSLVDGFAKEWPVSSTARDYEGLLFLISPHLLLGLTSVLNVLPRSLSFCGMLIR